MVSTTGDYWSDWETSSGKGIFDDSNFHYVPTTAPSYDYSHLSDEAKDAGVEPIQGNPEGAKFVISYALKEGDPVIFIPNKEDLMKTLESLMKDENVIKESILVHQIIKQFRPSYKIGLQEAKSPGKKSRKKK